MKFVLPIKLTPCFAATEQQLELLIGWGWLRLGEVNEAVEGEFDHVTKFVGVSHDSVERFTNLCEGGNEVFG